VPVICFGAGLRALQKKAGQTHNAAFAEYDREAALV
jgi:hypothetical protein